MYGIDEQGVWFAKQVPTNDLITVSVVRAQGDRFQRVFDNDATGEAVAMDWSLKAVTAGDAAFEVPLAAPEPMVVIA